MFLFVFDHIFHFIQYQVSGHGDDLHLVLVFLICLFHIREFFFTGTAPGSENIEHDNFFIFKQFGELCFRSVCQGKREIRSFLSSCHRKIDVIDFTHLVLNQCSKSEISCDSQCRENAKDNQYNTSGSALFLFLFHDLNSFIYQV